MRTSLVAALAGAALLAPPVAAAPPRALAGVTEIRAARAASMDVVLGRKVTLATPFGGGPHVVVTGGAALTSFVMVGSDERTSGVTLAGGASTVDGSVERFLMPVPQWPRPGGGTFEDLKTYSDTTVLPAGRYRLFAASSDRGTVTLRLPGLGGRTTLAPARPVAGGVRGADREVTASPARENVFAASGTQRFAGRGLALQILRARVESEAAWQLVMCHNNPAAAVADQLRDMPGCPSGDKHTLVTHRLPAVEPDTKLFVQAFAGLPPGEHGVSTVFTSESYVTGVSFAVLWLDYS